ncbi:hypothetical protein MTR_0072s0060 [Medicago truncatula]|uniref:Uncharacterized protein n=1 Tax=Medicago truncatula TaxID=3880 RepID=A0A072TJ55_MEDTR|nr:hypothetical protein MTR_0072s0060 [Medicago truncatula]
MPRAPSEPRNSQIASMTLSLAYDACKRDLIWHLSPPTLSCSSVELEYRGVVNVVYEFCCSWRHLRPTCPTAYQIADIFTKGLPLILFEDFRDILRLRQPLASTTGK